MNKVLRIVAALPGIFFVIVGLRWAIAPAGGEVVFRSPLPEVQVTRRSSSTGAHQARVDMFEIVVGASCGAQESRPEPSQLASRARISGGVIRVDLA